MKILNIDSFAQVTRQLSLKGKKYAVEETSVQQFIDNLKASEELEAQADAMSSPEAMAKSFEQAVKTVKEAVPTLPEAEIRALKLPAMSAVLAFIRGELDGENAPNQEEGTDAKKPS